MKIKALIAVSLLSLSAFASYEDHFPTYFEYCGAGRWKTTAGEIGGPTGHAFNYVHGLCKDYSQKYPAVIPCSEVSAELKAQYPHEGVGVSLDMNFSNLQWVAIPGRDLLLFGDLPRKQVSFEDIKDLKKKAIDLRIFEGAILHPKSVKNLTPDSPEYLDQVIEASLGTDIAIGWARQLYCVRIPVQQEKLKNLAQYLNQVNVQHKEKEYKWSMISNNCVHNSINAGHALGINKSIGTDEFILKQLLDLGVPANGYMKYADLAVLNKKKMGRIESAFKAEGFSPLQVGSLLMNYDAYPTGDKFTTGDIGFLSIPRFGKPGKFLMTPMKNEKHLTPENTDLKVNASVWKETYSKILTQAEDQKKDPAFLDYLKAQLQISQDIIDQE